MRAFSILIACAALAGCNAQPEVQPIDREALAHSEKVPPGAAFARWKADPNRLVADIPRAVSRCEWAMLHMQPRLRHGKAEPLEPDKPVEAMALLPDDREAKIMAWKVSDQEVAAAVRVGLFGDPDLELQYLKILASVMAGQPAPKRGGWFELPPLPDIPLVPGKKKK